MGKRQHGFSPEVKDLILDRATGNCERCGDLNNVRDHGAQYHHRRPRGMGGSRRPETNDASNGLWLCGDCHQYVESHRTEALEKGWLIRQTGDPCMTPVLYRGAWVVLDRDGYTYPSAAPAGDKAS